MLLPDINSILPIIHTYGYFVLFLIMFLEGPIVTFAAAFAASMGYFNPIAILVLSVLGNVSPDMMYFVIGKFVKKHRLYRILRRLGFNHKKILSFEKKFKAHVGKMMFLIKVVPGIPVPGLIVAGMVLPFKKFFKWSLLISFFYSLVFFVIGYFAGRAYNVILSYFRLGEIAFVLIVILFFVGWFALRKFMTKETKDYVK